MHSHKARRDIEKAGLRTIARMKFIFPDLTEVSYTHDFGVDYPEESAIFMFKEGNYACDCNRSLFIEEILSDFDGDWDCGDKIELKDFTVSKEA